MNNLDLDRISQIFLDCAIKEKFDSVLICKTSDYVRNAKNEIYKLYKKYGLDNWKFIGDHIYNLNNGSSITFKTANNNLRGYRFDSVTAVDCIVDEEDFISLKK